MEQYASNFSAEMIIEIRIPIPHAKAFCDWAVITSINEDMLVLQLSRDVLPEGVSLRVGQVLECRNVNDKNEHSHRAIVVRKGFAQEFQLRLIGEVTAEEPREFFRIDVFLPITYQSISNRNIYGIQKQWAGRRKQRATEEKARKKKDLEERTLKLNSSRGHLSGMSTAPPPRKEQGGKPEFVPYDESWNAVIPHAVNICGGGMSLVTSQQFVTDDYVQMEILIPSPQRVVDIVARVTFTNRNYAAGTDRNYYNAGMQFTYIDESDRTAIINYIANIQLQRIRQIQGFTNEPLFNAEIKARTDEDFIIRGAYNKVNEGKSSVLFGWLSLMVVLGMLVMCGIGMAIFMTALSSANGPFNGIGKSIGNSIHMFRDKIKQ